MDRAFPRTDEQVAELIHKILLAAHPEAMDQDEIAAVARWIEGAEIDRVILGLFEKGEVAFRWKDGDLKVCRRAQ